MFRTSLARAVSFIRDALRNESGGMALFMAFGAVAFVAFIGLSVDAIRGYLIHSRLSSALDAAGLAGARVIYSPNLGADIQNYFDANFPPGYLGAQVTGPSFTVSANQRVLTLNASATIDTTFMRVLGFTTLDVAAASQITRQTSVLDVVVAMDMSTSMTGDLEGNPGAAYGERRIDYARNAAQTMVTILHDTPGLPPNLNIGLVPWSSKVNVTLDGTTYDPDLTTAVSVAPFTNPVTGQSQSTVYVPNNSPVPLLYKPGIAEPYTDTNGNGQYDGVEDYSDRNRNGHYDSGEPYTDVNQNGQWDNTTTNEPFTDINGSGRWDGAYAWPGCVYARYTGDSTDNDADLDIGPELDVGTQTPHKDYPAWDPVDLRGEPLSGGGCSKCIACQSQGITPLKNDATDHAAIVAAVDGLTSPQGSTEMVSGLGWAWRVLVPDAPFTQANPNPPGNRIQAIVLLTDGEYYGYYGDAYDRQFGGGSSAGGTINGNKGYGRLKKIADKIKAAGILIYVVQFAEVNASLQAILEQIASAPSAPYYYNAPNDAQLNAAFTEIAKSLSELRVSM